MIDRNVDEALKLLREKGFYIVGGPKRTFLTKTTKKNKKTGEIVIIYGLSRKSNPPSKDSNRTKPSLNFSIESRQYSELDPELMEWVDYDIKEECL